MPTATMSTRGRVTIPRAVREQLGLHEGVRLEFFVKSDGMLTIRPLKGSVSDLFGSLQRERAWAVSIEEMDGSIGEGLSEEDGRLHGDSS